MIQINGVDIPTPTTFQVGIQDVCAYAERTADGDMKREVKTTKRKLDLTYTSLTGANMTALLTAIAPASFTVQYPDPQTGTLTTKTFYCGDRTAGAIDYKGSAIRWKDLKFNLVEV